MEAISLLGGFGMGEEAETDDGAGQVQQRQHRGGLAVVTDRELSEGHEPPLRPLYDPPVAPQPLAGLHTPAGDPRSDAPRSQGSEVVGLVCGASADAAARGWVGHVASVLAVRQVA
jgi:hypothetical protein